MTSKKMKIKIDKYFDKTTDKNMLEIEVSKELSELLIKFAVVDEQRDTDFPVEELRERNRNPVEYKKRYLVKSILKNSVDWEPLFDLLFTEDILKNQKVKIPLNSLNVFRDVNISLLRLKELIKVCKDISEDKQINVTINIDEE